MCSRHTTRVLAGALLVMAVACGPAVAYLSGFFNLGSEGTRAWINTTGVGVGSGSGNTLSDGGDAEVWAGNQGTGEVGWSVDWHALSVPTRTVKLVVLYPGTRTPGHFILWKGTWGGSSMTWSNAYEYTLTNVYQNFKPVFLPVDIRNASGLKYEVVAIGPLSYITGSTNRGMANILLFGDGRRDPFGLTNLVSATQSADAPYTVGYSASELAKTFDGEASDVQGYNNSTTQRYESITYSFSRLEHLIGVFVTLNTIHSPVYCWKTWDIRNSSDEVLASSQLGINGDNTIAGVCDRYQFLRFTNSYARMNRMVMQGKFGLLAPPGDVTHASRMGEIWGILALPQQLGTMIIVR